MSNKSCFICEKHENLTLYAGPVIAEDKGICITHFPMIESEPASLGRLLVEPRRHIEDFHEMTLDEAAALGRILKKGVDLLKSKLNVEHVYVFRINDKVTHLHFHLVPRFKSVPREFWGLKILEWPDAKVLNLNEIKRVSADLEDQQKP